jgi:ATP-binding cassette subfamily B protein
MLDSMTENALNAAIQTVNRHCAILVIAHRLTTIRNADTIVFVHEGRVDGTGTHEELLGANCRYRALVGGKGVDEHPHRTVAE